MLRPLRQMPLFLLCMALLLLLALATVFGKYREQSAMENRTLAPPVTVTLAGIRSGAVMRQTEEYLTDHFIARDAFVLLAGGMDTALLRTEKNGHPAGLPPDGGYAGYRDGYGRAECAGHGRDCQAHRHGCHGRHRAAFLRRHAGAPAAVLPAADQKALLDALYTQSGLPAIDTLQALLPLGEAAYYRTDHHWTADGAAAVYRALCEAWGLTAAPPAARLTADAFFGSYYAKVPRPFMQGDRFAFDQPDGVRLVIDGEAMPGLLDTAQLQARDKYAALLYGNHARITLEGPGEGTLLVVKDSYANALLPLLAQHFRRVEVFDPRYSLQRIDALYMEVHADRLLYVYGLSTLLTDRNLITQTVWEEN